LAQDNFSFGLEFELKESSSGFIGLILESINRRDELQITYKGQASYSTISPVKVFRSSKYPGQEYLRARLKQTGEIRVFRLDKLKIHRSDGSIVCQTDERSNDESKSQKKLGVKAERSSSKVPLCQTPNCNNPATLKEKRDGRPVYRKVCYSCHTRKDYSLDLVECADLNGANESQAEDTRRNEMVENGMNERNQRFQKSPEIDQSFMEARYREMREKLLDFSRRNPLINFNHTESGVGYLRIVDETPELLLDKLVSEPMSFKALPDTDDEPPDEGGTIFQSRVTELRLTDQEFLRFLGDEALRNSDPENFEEALQKEERKLKDRVRVELDLPPLQRGGRVDMKVHAKMHGINPDYELPRTSELPGHQDNLLQTLLTPDALDRRLRNVYSKYSTHLRETGINVLQIAFGFLEWSEVKVSERRNMSPLLLLPLSMERKKTKSGYKYQIQAEDDRPILNHTLREKLEKEFGLTIPQFEDEGIEEIFEALQEVFLGQQKWGIRRYVTVGAFPFSTIMIYRDLFPEAWADQEICSHDSVAKLLGGSQPKQTSFIDYVEDIDRLTINQEAPPLIVEADSSQHSAIYEVTKGDSLVIQGPPGTGKSQTITNLIASAVSAGKRVLFVAEKQPALNVVSNRLKASGLGPITFEPQRGAAKSAVLDSIQERLKLKVEFDQKGYEAQKEALRQQFKFSSEVKSLLESKTAFCGVTLFELIWKFLDLRHDLPESFLSNVPEIGFTGEVLGSELEALNQLVDEAFSLKYLQEDGEAAYQINKVQTNEIFVRSIQQDSRNLLGALDETRGFRIFLEEKVNQISFERTISLIDLLLRKNIAVISTKAELELTLSATQLKLKELDQLIWIENYRTTYQGITLETLIDIIGLGLTLEITEVNSLTLSNRRSSLEKQRAYLSQLRKHSTAFEGCEGYPLEPLYKLVLLAQRFPIDDFKYFYAIDKSFELNVYFEKELESKWLELSELKRLFGKLFPTKDLSSFVDTISSTQLKEYIKIFSEGGFLSFLSSDFKRSRDTLSTLGLDTSNKIATRTIGKELVDLLSRVEIFQSNLASSRILSALFLDLRFDKDDLDPLFTRLARLRSFDRDLTEACRLGISKPTLLDVYKIHGEILSFDVLRNPVPPSGSTFAQISNELDGQYEASLRLCDVLEEIRKLAGTFEVKFDTLMATIKEYSRGVVSPSGEKLSPAYWLSSFPDSVRTRYLVDSKANLIELREATRQHLASFEQSLEIHRELQSFVDPNQGSAFEELYSFDLSQNQITEKLQSFRGLLADYISKYEVEVMEVMKSEESLVAFLCELASTPTTTLLDQIKKRKFNTKIDDAGVRSYFCSEYFQSTVDSTSAYQALEYLLVNAALKHFSDEHSIPLAELTGAAIERNRGIFKNVDSRLKKLEAVRTLQVGASRSIPRGIGYGPKKSFTELSLIENELSKKKGHIPLRALITRARGALLAMKPIWLMQPLAVSQFLPKSRELFDLVIIDEASQMLPENAIASLLRGSQIVVVGDTQQMPPSNLFNVALDYSEEDAPEVESESILDLASQRLGNTISLRWHYRSRHPSLIRFSNYHFYDNRLEVVPSPVESAATLGVKSIKVDGIYKDGLNVKEAIRVIEEARRCMENSPNCSLGIVSMNLKQKDFIEEELIRLADTDPIVRAYFDKWGDDDLQYPFINNLERVQGDERDIIIVSTVYGPDESGNMYQRFPLINSETGHRRLNVLFTRARNSLILVTSMTPSQIKVDEASSRGKRILRDYIEYAATGHLPLANESGAEPDSDFERFVIKALLQNGYDAIPQVGVKGFSIDIGVQHKDYPYGFIAGIECDGATFHSTPAARDRDRIRQDILESLGWKIYRIWSTDWFADPSRETARLLDWLSSQKDPRPPH
jgi:hypothetical protein